MYRLNVGRTQHEACVEYGLFALQHEPKIKRGELLLLQLKKNDWKSLKTNCGRIKYALVFDRAEHDPEGLLSRQYWPDAGKQWPWIVHASAVLKVEPFSLENLSLARESKYQCQQNLISIDKTDENIIHHRILWNTAIHAKGSGDEELTWPENTIEIEKFAIEKAKEIVATWFPEADIVEMPPNHPGFDLLIKSGSKVIRYIEVKGTQKSAPVFFMTECERKWSAANSGCYTAVVVWGIDLNTKKFKVFRHDGEVITGLHLHPFVYAGQFNEP